MKWKLCARKPSGPCTGIMFTYSLNTLHLCYRLFTRLSFLSPRLVLTTNSFLYYFVFCFLWRFYQMDKTCLQDHVGKIRAALCDKGRTLFSFVCVPCIIYCGSRCALFPKNTFKSQYPSLNVYFLLQFTPQPHFTHFPLNTYRPLCDVRHAAVVPSHDSGRRERVQRPRAELCEHFEADHRPPTAEGLWLSPHPFAVDPGALNSAYGLCDA